MSLSVPAQSSCPLNKTRSSKTLPDLKRLKLALGLFLGITTGLCAQTSVTTQHNDIGRTGANTSETILTPSNVNASTFGKLFSQSVDGYVYAQPLYLPGVKMGTGTAQAGTTHNVVFVATEHCSVYAFDADTNGGANASPLWHITLLDAAHGAASCATTVPNGDVDTGDIVPEIGITGTPVIDPASQTIYVVGKTKENGSYVQRLHALDITSGNEKFGGPVVLSGSVAGTGNGSSGGTLNWDALWENNRAGLLFLNGIVYIGFAAHGDNGPWHGWLLAYNATTLKQTSAYCASPNGTGAGMWMSGSGLAADLVTAPYGRMFVATGNGSFDAKTPNTNNMDYGDSHLRLDLTGGVLTVKDSFTPQNQASLNSADMDVAAGGVLVLPDQSSGGHTHLLLQLGKEGKIYLVDRDSMTGFNTPTDKIVQEVAGETGSGLWGMPAYWNGNVYIWGHSDYLKAFSFAGGVLSQTPTSTSTIQANGGYSPTPSVSANGTTNGIVWTIASDINPEILDAFDASNVATHLYSSSTNSSRDNPGGPVKFIVPTVVNGKVYAGAQSKLSVFGLLGGSTPVAATPVLSPASETFTGSIQVTMTDTTAGSTIYYTTDGSTPTTASTPYTGAITVNTTETVTAIASASGYLQSAAASATYTLQTQTLAPTFSPAAGSFTTAQTVSLLDGTPGSKIYYTTDGSTPAPNTGLTQPYTARITVNATTTIKAIAVASGLSNSPVSSALYTITLAGSGVNFSGGFAAAASSMTFNGSTDLDDTRLQLTNGGTNEAGSAFYNTPVNIQKFTTDFTFQLSNAGADGITFTIQGNGPTALGPYGGGLGYGPDTPGGTGGIPNSVAIKFDTYSNDGEGDDSTGLYTGGASPTLPSIDLTNTGIDLHSDDTMSVHLAYDGTTLTMLITDPVANTTYTTSWTVNIPTAVGGSTAYVGFTGGTGGETSSQKIGSWTFVSTAGQTAAAPVFNPVQGTYTGTQTVTITDTTAGASIYYTTDGTTPTTSSTQYTGPITVNASETINAIAVALGYAQSAVASSIYTINPPAATTPSFSPVGGTYTSAQTVTIADATSGASIYYTTDGTTPSTSSTPYAGAITVKASETINAIAVAPGYTQSPVASSIYTINLSVAATPSISPVSGAYTSAQTVTITDATSGASIYYTTDGTTPTTSSIQYTGAITVTVSETINAIAVASGYSNSVVATVVYTFSTSDFSVSANSPSLTVQSGGQGADVITIAAKNGAFGSVVQLSCAVTGPAPIPTCALSPVSVTPGSGSSTSTLTIAAGVLAAFEPSKQPHSSGLLYAFCLPLTTLGITLIVGAKRERRRWVPSGLLVSIVLFLVACGSVASNNGGKQNSTNYTVTVTGASGTIQHATQIVVTVQ